MTDQEAEKGILKTMKNLLNYLLMPFLLICLSCNTKNEKRPNVADLHQLLKNNESIIESYLLPSRLDAIHQESLTGRINPDSMSAYYQNITKLRSTYKKFVVQFLNLENQDSLKARILQFETEINTIVETYDTKQKDDFKLDLNTNINGTLTLHSMLLISEKIKKTIAKQLEYLVPNSGCNFMEHRLAFKHNPYNRQFVVVPNSIGNTIHSIRLDNISINNQDIEVKMKFEKKENFWIVNFLPLKTGHYEGNISVTYITPQLDSFLIIEDRGLPFAFDYKEGATSNATP